MNKKYIYYKFLIITFFVLLLFSIIMNFSSCKMRNKMSEDNLLVEDEEGEKIFIVEQSDQYQNVNWEEEKKKLEGVGKINDVPTYCLIVSIISIELKKLEEEMIIKKFSEEEKSNQIINKRDELLKYFNITQKDLDEFYEKNKVMIENFIITHNEFRKALEIE